MDEDILETCGEIVRQAEARLVEEQTGQTREEYLDILVQRRRLQEAVTFPLRVLSLMMLCHDPSHSLQALRICHLIWRRAQHEVMSSQIGDGRVGGVYPPIPLCRPAPVMS
ncbi:hypothetical protein EPA93_45020 [Ktedonosporobacter rubrisoli]|uniref:Uncharacterized protein n=1 Tax=Ktedonosporobacter rubrisoli TaxID=2509675 RepID=A0A4V0Z0C6_KTERU|nr:hypothetical protein [Ktedonosporobacter rubrisoli]QBD82751.1 hypothetical protein EPA93_45020 [Ktedonosporobacter rubrisoli]